MSTFSKLSILIISLLSFVACGGAVEDAQDGAPFCDSSGWVIYDVQPGQCMVAWSKGNNVPTWKESVAKNCQAANVCGLERAQNIHVDSTPYEYGCNEFAQTGDIVMATDEPVSVAIKIDDPSKGSVEFFDIGSPECELVARDLARPGSNGHVDGY
jgi:hypothetical protein